MYEWAEVAAVIVTLVVLFAQLTYKIGTLEARCTATEQTMTWIRDYLLTSHADVDKFKQASAITMKKRILPNEMTATLDTFNIDYKKCHTCYDFGAKFSDKYGLMALKGKAERHGMKLNDLVLACGVYLFENRGKK